MLETIDQKSVGKDWGWVLAAGIALIALGLVTLNWPLISSIGLSFALGIVLLVSGFVQGVYAIRLRQDTGNGWRVFQSIVALVAGGVMLRYPAVGMEGIAIAMSFYFFVSATAKAMLALGMRPAQGWGWVLASAIASLVLGAYLIAKFPVAALWVPGFLLGIDLVMYGSTLIDISLVLKKIHKEIMRMTNTNTPTGYVH